MMSFIGGLLIGFGLGVFTMCLLAMARREEPEIYGGHD